MPLFFVEVMNIDGTLVATPYVGAKGWNLCKRPKEHIYLMLCSSKPWSCDGKPYIKESNINIPYCNMVSMYYNDILLLMYRSICVHKL